MFLSIIRAFYFRDKMRVIAYIIARQHASHAERDIDLPILSSVCLSVCPMPASV